MAKALVFLFIIAAVSGLLQDPLLPKADLLSRGARRQDEIQESDIKNILNSESSRFNPDVQNVYHLFTRSNPSISQPLVLGAQNLVANSYYDPQKRTILLIHGWLSTVITPFNIAVVPAFLSAEDVNVIAVDWSHGSGSSLDISFPNAVPSGESTARFVTWLNDITGASVDMYHIIGYSLGAHKAGIVGRNLGGKVPYITALDAAGFGWTSDEQRFRADDGVYTESIHTSAGVVGYLTALGKTSFYPNGGFGMPGCSDAGCDHDRAFYYFAESIVSGGFTGERCETFVHALVENCGLEGPLKMGGLVPKTGETGIFALQTNAGIPFSRG